MSLVIRALGSIGTVAVLLFAGATSSSAVSTPDQGAELIRAASKDATKVRELLEAGAAVNAVGKEGMTPLLAAVQSGKLEIVELLLNRGADVKIQNTIGRNALITAAMLGRPDIVKLLLERGAGVNAIGRYKENALSAASQYGRKDVVTMLLDHGAHLHPKVGHDPLVMAAIFGQTGIIDLLLGRGANVNVQTDDSFGVTALMMAAIATRLSPCRPR